MSDYPQETIDTLRNVIAAQKVKIEQLQESADLQYQCAVFYKAQWEDAEAKLILKGE